MASHVGALVSLIDIFSVTGNSKIQLTDVLYWMDCIAWV